MAPIRSRLATLTAIALGVTSIGAADLLVAALGELLTQPGLTLVDAYWVGRLPWTAIAIGLVLLGGTAAVVIGAITAWLLPGLVARAVSIPSVLAVAFWWATSVLQASSGACCGPVSYDPFTVAYSSPHNLLVFVVLPALVMGAGVLTPAAPRTKLRPTAVGPRTETDKRWPGSH